MPDVIRESKKRDIHQPGASVDIAIAEESASKRWITPGKILCSTFLYDFPFCVIIFCGIVFTSPVIRGLRCEEADISGRSHLHANTPTINF